MIIALIGSLIANWSFDNYNDQSRIIGATNILNLMVNFIFQNHTMFMTGHFRLTCHPVFTRQTQFLSGLLLLDLARILSLALCFIWSLSEINERDGP